MLVIQLLVIHLISACQPLDQHLSAARAWAAEQRAAVAATPFLRSGQRLSTLPRAGRAAERVGGCCCCC